MNWYLSALRKFAFFSGRSRRKEYWYFTLFNFLAIFALLFIEGLLGIPAGQNGGVLVVIYGLVVIVPALAVTVRRLHDTDRSAWWLLINIIPVIGAIVHFVFMILDSSPGENRYGANPKN